MVSDTNLTDGQEGLPCLLLVTDFIQPEMEIGDVTRGILLHLALHHPIRAIEAVNGISRLFRERSFGKGQMSPHVIARDTDAPDDASNQIRFYINWQRPEVTVQFDQHPYWDIRDTHAHITDAGMPDAMWHALVARLPQVHTLGDIMDMKLTSGAPRTPLTQKTVGTRDTVQSGPGFITKTIRQIMFEWRPRFIQWKRTHAALSRIIERSLADKDIRP